VYVLIAVMLVVGLEALMLASAQRISASAGLLLLMRIILIFMFAMSRNFRKLTAIYLQYFFCCQKDFEPLGCLFEYFLVAPASSALVDRVLIVCPQRAKMSDKFLESLAFATSSSLRNASKVTCLRLDVFFMVSCSRLCLCSSA